MSTDSACERKAHGEGPCPSLPVPLAQLSCAAGEAPEQGRQRQGQLVDSLLNSCHIPDRNMSEERKHLVLRMLRDGRLNDLEEKFALTFSRHEFPGEARADPLVGPLRGCVAAEESDGPCDDGSVREDGKVFSRVREPVSIGSLLAVKQGRLVPVDRISLDPPLHHVGDVGIDGSPARAHTVEALAEAIAIFPGLPSDDEDEGRTAVEEEESILVVESKFGKLSLTLTVPLQHRCMRSNQQNRVMSYVYHDRVLVISPHLADPADEAERMEERSIVSALSILCVSESNYVGGAPLLYHEILEAPRVLVVYPHCSTQLLFQLPIVLLLPRAFELALVAAHLERLRVEHLALDPLGDGPAGGRGLMEDAADNRKQARAPSPEDLEERSLPASDDGQGLNAVLVPV
eukprot:765770-Hanusia_phi.AAC.6